jgi:SAM-dependent methyltransferase
MRKVNELEHTYLNKNPIVSLFSKLKVKLAVRIAGLKRNDLILDFGCGSGWLKNNLRKQGYNVVGYDVIPEQSDIKDYKKIRPDKIFVLDVFEHIPKEEIGKIIEEFKLMNQNFELITAIPTEGFFWKLARKLAGKSEKIEEHITPLKEILKIINGKLILIKKFNFLTLSYIAKFKNN